MLQLLLHVLSLIATTPTEKAELAVGRIVIKYAQRGAAYYATPEGEADFASFVALAKDFGATETGGGLTLPATASHPQTVYLGAGSRDGVGGHLMPAGM